MPCLQRCDRPVTCCMHALAGLRCADDFAAAERGRNDGTHGGAVQCPVSRDGKGAAMHVTPHRPLTLLNTSTARSWCCPTYHTHTQPHIRNHQVMQDKRQAARSASSCLHPRDPSPTFTRSLRPACIPQAAPRAPPATSVQLRVDRGPLAGDAAARN